MLVKYLEGIGMLLASLVPLFLYAMSLSGRICTAFPVLKMNWCHNLFTLEALQGLRLRPDLSSVTELIIDPSHAELRR